MLFMDPFAPLLPLQRQTAFLPEADVMVSDGDIVLTMDLPGLKPEDLDIQLLDGDLVVRGERVRPQLAEGARWAHNERGFGSFERRIRLPDGVDPDAITASMDDGVLSLLVPKPEKLVPRTISIASGDAQPELETTTA